MTRDCNAHLPPSPPQEGYVYTPPPHGPELSLLQHETETEYTTDDRTEFFMPLGEL
jgi:hypothetical protein